jgi:ribosome-associated protein
MHPRPYDPDKLVETVITSLDDDKAEDVLTIDLRGRSSIADHIVIATGRSQRQLGAMAQHLLEKMKGLGLDVSLEGMTQGDWVLLDGGDIVVHLFRPEVRSFYNLEGMWGLPPVQRVVDAVGQMVGQAAGQSIGQSGGLHA